MKLLSILVLWVSVLSAQGYFIGHDDICKPASDHYCSNEKDVVKNLQLALASDRHLNRVIKMDGIFGNDTHEAIIAFQKQYKIDPADGWVGKGTKEKLDQIYGMHAFSFSRHGDICEEVEGQECPNEFETVRNFQIVMNFDKNMSVELEMDGHWGKNTRLTATKMQKVYHMVQVMDGLVKVPSGYWTGWQRACSSLESLRCIDRSPAARLRHVRET